MEQQKDINQGLKSSKLEKVLYGIGDIGVNLIWILPGSFLTMYYTDSVGMSAAFVGTMMLICRLFDGLSDVAMGIIIDKTRTRWGKARPWLLFACLPLVLSVFFVFFVPSGLSASGKNMYAAVTYFIMSVFCFTAVNLAYHSLLPRFSLTSQDRSSVTVIRTVFAMVAILGISMFIPSMITAFGGFDSQRAWSIIVLIFGAIALAAMLITFFGVKEKLPLDTVDENGAVKKTPVLQGLKVLASNRYFYIAIVLFIVNAINSGTTGIQIYYARDVLGDANLYGVMTMMGMIPAMLGSVFVPLLFKKFGKRKTVCAGVLFSAVANAIILTNPTSIPLYFTMTIFRGLGNAPLSVAAFTLAGDIVDYNQWRTGIRTEGITTSVNSIGTKLGTGLGAALLGWMLAWGGYERAATVQAASAIQAMIILAVLVPLIVNVLAFILMGMWNLEKYQGDVIAFINEQNAKMKGEG